LIPEVPDLPTYEYRCIECGHQYERREGFDAPALQHCPKCGGESRRVLYAPPILFKSSGFYVTDNRKGGLVGASPAASGSDGGDGEKGDFTVEAAPPADKKPAAKTPEKSSEAAAAS
jgi:putative FmdB family regulatory protein